MTFDTLFAIAFFLALGMAFCAGYAVAHIHVMRQREGLLRAAQDAFKQLLKKEDKKGE